MISAVNAEGNREILGVRIGDSESIRLDQAFFSPKFGLL